VRKHKNFSAIRKVIPITIREKGVQKQRCVRNHKNPKCPKDKIRGKHLYKFATAKTVAEIFKTPKRKVQKTK
jgi:hypothetical protein